MTGNRRWLLLGSVWLVLVGMGFGFMLVYEATPGTDRPTPKTWPTPEALRLSAQRPTLVMFAHPQCPCTRASISELAELMARSQGLVDAHVLFIQPKGESETWVKSDLWRAAAAIPGVSVQIDQDGRLAKLFGAETSGRVVLYDAQGRLAFSGGITESRGHAGDNDGVDSLEALLHHQASHLAATPVYGCSMISPNPLAPAACKQ